MKITIYELMGLIKDNKAPKKIKIDNDTWYFVKRNSEIYYIDKEEYCFHCCQLNFEYYIENNKLNKKVEILSEENDEREDNETLKFFKKVCDELIQYEKYTSLMNFYHKKNEQLQQENKKLKETLENNSRIGVSDHKYASEMEDKYVESNYILTKIEKWLGEQNPYNLNENFVSIRLADIKNELQKLKGKR